MSTLAESTIVSKVRLNLDEIGLNDASSYLGSDESELDTIIKDKIKEAIVFVHGNADITLLDFTDSDIEKTVASTSATQLGSSGYYVVSIDAKDYVRVASVKLPEWTRGVPADEFINETDIEYSALQNPLTTGTPERPKVGMTSGKVLKLYTTDDPSKLSKAYLYGIKTPTLGADNKWSVSKKLEDAFYYYVTGLVLLVLRDNHADAMFHQALVCMGLSDVSK